MVKRLTKDVTSDCGNTFTSFGKLPTFVEPPGNKSQVRKLKAKPKEKKIREIVINAESSSDDEVKQRG